MDIIRPFEDLEALPRWAAVAFAARSARRVLPFLRRDWPDAPENFVSAVRLENCYAETAAGLGVVPDPFDEELILILGVRSLAEREGRAIASHVAYAADLAFKASKAPDPRSAALEAAAEALRTGEGIDEELEVPEARDFLAERMREDLELLLSAVRESRWTDSTPVPGNFFLTEVWPTNSRPSWVAKKQAQVDEETRRLWEAALDLFDENEHEACAAACDAFILQFGERPRWVYLWGTSLLELAGLALATDHKDEGEKLAGRAQSRLERALELVDFAPALGVPSPTTKERANYHHNLAQAARHVVFKGDIKESLPIRVSAKYELDRALALVPDHKGARDCLAELMLVIEKVDDDTPPLDH